MLLTDAGTQSIEDMKSLFGLDANLTIKEAMEEILEEYPQYFPSILALFHIAKGIALQMPKHWDEKRVRGGEALDMKIQGTLSRELVLAAFKDSPSSEVEFIYPSNRFLKQWINAASPEELKVFVTAVTGKSSLLPRDKVYIKYTRDVDGRAPVAHTCFNQLDLPDGYSSYEDFCEKLQYLLVSEGMTLA